MEEDKFNESSFRRKRIKIKKKRTFFRSLVKNIRKKKNAVISTIVIVFVLLVTSFIIYSVIDQQGINNREKIKERIEKKIKQFEGSKNN